jgi:hypothetical protein
MLVLVTPRVEVLAVLTADGEEPELVPVEVGAVPADAAPVDVLDGAVATQATVPTRTAPTRTTVRIWVERERRRKWPHDRATPARGFQRLSPLMGAFAPSGARCHLGRTDPAWRWYDTRRCAGPGAVSTVPSSTTGGSPPGSGG